jgi:hypothetical protein
MALDLKNKWASYVEKGALAVLGFLAVFLFNSVMELKGSVAALQEKRTGDVAQWEMIRRHTQTMAELEAQQMVHDKIISDYTSQLINRRIVIALSTDARSAMSSLPPERTTSNPTRLPEPVLKSNLKPPLDTQEVLKKLEEIRRVEPIESYQRRMIQQFELPASSK